MGEARANTVEYHLVRHGETDWNASGRVQGQAESRLSPRGVSQARALGVLVDPRDYDAVYCSSSVRTRQTLDNILNGRTCDIGYRDDLREIHLGPWQGLLRSAVKEQWSAEFDDFLNAPEAFALEAAETFVMLQERALGALADMAHGRAGQRVMVVSHGALIKTVYCAAAGLALSDVWSSPAADNCARFVVSLSEDGALTFCDHHAGGDALHSD